MEEGQPITKALLTHLRHELIHAVWTQLLDDEFLQAWRQGIVVTCADGITRRVFPRIFSYSADYPEKYVKTPNSWKVVSHCLLYDYF